MKKILILLSAALILGACEEELNYEFETKLVKDIDVVVDKPADAMRSSSYPFETVEIIDLKDNGDFQKYIDDLEEVKVKNVSCKLSGVNKGDTIKKLSINIMETDFNLSFTDLTEITVDLPVDLAQTVLNTLEPVMMGKKQLKIKVSGESSVAPLDFKVNLTIDSKVKTTLSKK